MKLKHILLSGLFLIAMALVLTACSTPTVEATPCPQPSPCPDCPVPPTPAPCPDCPTCPEPVVKDVPFEQLWVNSAHADASAEAFTHWDEADPKEVPTSCARCHSTPGYIDYLGGDGTEAFKVDNAAPIGTVITCEACHNDAAVALDKVIFPSGAEITGLGPEARCMTCHQGRASVVQVNDAITSAGVDDDTISADLGFINIHYFAAGATLYGTEAKGGYEYEGMTYDGKFRHVTGIETCLGCHNQHSLEVKVDVCAGCHEGVTTVEDLRDVRMNGSLADYDGDGNTTEGISSEITGMLDILYSAIQSYAKDVAGTGIVYDAASYPYFFADADGDGKPDTSDSGSVGFASWTPRLLKAAYNYQTVTKDPGAFAHNAKYMIELMYDSVADLNSKLGTIDMTAMHRDDPGHFAGDTEPFRHWDSEGEVPGSCARCHSATGIPTFIKEGVNVSAETANGFMCTTCHTTAAGPDLYAVTNVTFPSGAVLTFSKPDAEGNLTPVDANLCLLCHQGRSSTPNVDNALKGKEADTPDPSIRFTNVHYFAAAATLFGSEAEGAYQFAGKEYSGVHPHVSQLGFTCASCHDVHALTIKTEVCAGCHAGSSDPQDPATYRMNPTDWDGDGNVTEGIKGEIQGFADRLYAAIQAYAKDKGTPIVYDAASYPYFFVDSNEDGVPDVGDNGSPVGYNAFTPNLLKAGYNYQYWVKDPGAFAHNGVYVLQFLYDSIEVLGGDTTGLTRPEVAPAQ